MDAVKAICGHRWFAPAALIAGLVVMIAPIFTIDAYGGASLQRLGQVLTVLAGMRIGYLARTDHARATYRYLRCAKRTEPVVTRTGPDDK